jgi:hypothetical protein
MSRMTTKDEELARLAFAEKAAEDFIKNPKHWSYGDLTPGSLLAIRWGMGEDCVLVLKLDEYHENVNYQQLARRTA